MQLEDYTECPTELDYSLSPTPWSLWIWGILQLILKDTSSVKRSQHHLGSFTVMYHCIVCYFWFVFLSSYLSKEIDTMPVRERDCIRLSVTAHTIRSPLQDGALWFTLFFPGI